MKASITRLFFKRRRPTLCQLKVLFLTFVLCGVMNLMLVTSPYHDTGQNRDVFRTMTNGSWMNGLVFETAATSNHSQPIVPPQHPVTAILRNVEVAKRKVLSQKVSAPIAIANKKSIYSQLMINRAKMSAAKKTQTGSVVTSNKTNVDVNMTRRGRMESALAKMETHELRGHLRAMLAKRRAALHMTNRSIAEMRARGLARFETCDACFKHDFDVIIPNKRACAIDYKAGGSWGIDLLVLIATEHDAWQRRQILRRTWLTPSRNNTSNVRYVFLLGGTSNITLNADVHKEAELYGDIVMEDFVDSYNNLTLKTIMAFKWATQHCPEAQYVIKTDHDMFINITNVFNVISPNTKMLETKLIGSCDNWSKPHRSNDSKWYVPLEEYKWKYYPPFCSGTGYIASMNVVKRVYGVSQNVPFYWLEDVYVGLCLVQLNYSVSDYPGFHRNLEKCVHKNGTFVTMHFMNNERLTTLWDKGVLCTAAKKYGRSRGVRHGHYAHQTLHGHGIRRGKAHEYSFKGYHKPKHPLVAANVGTGNEKQQHNGFRLIDHHNFKVEPKKKKGFSSFKKPVMLSNLNHNAKQMGPDLGQEHRKETQLNLKKTDIRHVIQNGPKVAPNEAVAPVEHNKDELLETKIQRVENAIKALKQTDKNNEILERVRADILNGNFPVKQMDKHSILRRSETRVIGHKLENQQNIPNVLKGDSELGDKKIYQHGRGGVVAPKQEIVPDFKNLDNHGFLDEPKRDNVPPYAQHILDKHGIIAALKEDVRLGRIQIDHQVKKDDGHDRQTVDISDAIADIKKETHNIDSLANSHALPFGFRKPAVHKTFLKPSKFGRP